MRITGWTNSEYASNHFIDLDDQRLALWNSNKKLISPDQARLNAEKEGISLEKYFANYQKEYEKIPFYTDEQKANRLIEIEKQFQDITVEYCRKTGIRFPSDYHQNGMYGLPVFDDKYVCMLTLRQWGALMAKADGNTDEYGYLDYYLYSQNNSKLKLLFPYDKSLNEKLYN